ncbi:MAG: OmpH family outer membrane protein [Gemmatimonadaceae bacterium]
MRSIVRLSLIAAVAGAASTSSVTAQAPTSSGRSSTTPRIVYIRSQEIIASAPGRAEAEAQFQREMTAYRQQIQRMGDSLNALVAEYNKQEVILSPAAKESRQKEVRAKEEQFQQRTQQLEQQAQQREAELVRPIMEQINRIIQTIRAEEGYAMVFDAGSASGVVVAADTSLDITAKVIARLKTAGPAAARKGEAKPAGAPVSQPSGVTRPKTPPETR